VASPIPVEDARALVLGAVRPLGFEEVALEAALGRALAEEVVSPIDLPPFDSSAMDGYAVRAGPPAELGVVGEARAGHPAGVRVGDGEAVRISTGAPVPEGAEAVVPIERVEELGEERVRAGEARPGANLRRAGEDVSRGQAVFGPGCELGPAELGMLASMGRARVRVGRRPRAALLVTGDELARPGEPLGPGQIYGSNEVTLTAQARRAGADVVLRAGVPDNRQGTEAALEAALAAADLVLVSGGVSVGPHDHVKPALAALGVSEVFRLFKRSYYRSS